MLDFLFCVAAVGAKPLSLAAGLFTGYLFHKEWRQLAWPLLLFIFPGIGGLDAATPAHGAMYQSAAEFIAIGLLAFGFCWAFDYFAGRRRVQKSEF